MLHPFWLHGISSQTLSLVFFVIPKVAVEEFNMGIAFEREDMGTNAVEEETVVRDDHCAAGL